MNNKGVYRTAPAKLGLFINFNNSFQNNLACEQCTSGESESLCPNMSRLGRVEVWPGPVQTGGHGDVFQQGPGGQGQEKERRGSVLNRRLACSGASQSGDW